MSATKGMLFNDLRLSIVVTLCYELMTQDTSEASPQTDERVKAISLEIEFITEPCVANQLGI